MSFRIICFLVVVSVVTSLTPFIRANALAKTSFDLLPFDLVYRHSGLSQKEIKRRKDIQANLHRPAVLIIDDEIDLFHPELYYKLDRNKLGLLPPDYFQTLIKKRNLIMSDSREEQLASHGTMTSDIALAGVEYFSLVSVPQILSRIKDDGAELFLSIEQLIKKHSIQFANMSFDIVGPQEDPSEIPIDGEFEKDLRPYVVSMMKNTPQTLYTVVASNSGIGFGVGLNLDHRVHSLIMPVMAELPNMIVVGALNTANLVSDSFHIYQRATFSNYGTRFVDILAPGENICAAKTGGGTICANGTSFSAPYVLNQGVLKVHVANPDLSIFAIKEILMKTAYVPYLMPFKVKSGGILYPERAEHVALWLRQHPELSIEEAVLTLRKHSVPLQGEGNDDTYLKWLMQLWHERGIGRRTSFIMQPEFDKMSPEAVS